MEWKENHNDLDQKVIAARKEREINRQDKAEIKSKHAENSGISVFHE